MGGYKYNPEKDIGSLEGKVILVTGGTSPIGRAVLTTWTATDDGLRPLQETMASVSRQSSS